MLLSVVTASAHGLSLYDQNMPFGWGSVETAITGSSDENPIIVTTLEELKAALDKNSKTVRKTIYIKGVITVSGQFAIKDQENKTIYGLPGSAIVNTTHSGNKAESGILQLTRCKNMILRNLTFKGAGAYDIDGNDNLTLYECSHLWIDHCDFQDGVDGNLDCSNGSDFITVTWCRFHYLIDPWSGGSGGSNDHRFTNLWGSSDTAKKDPGHLNTTFANCWWDEGCKERMPRIRFGKVHILNCLYSSSVANYCVGAGYQSNAYVENCAFTSKNAMATPWKIYATKSGYTDYNITLTGNLGAADTQERSGNNDYFTPSSLYNYQAYEASLVESVVSNGINGAGATLSIAEKEKFTTEYVRGDANGNKTVDADDIVEITDYMMGKASDRFLFNRADANGDGAVNIADVIFIANILNSRQTNANNNL